MGILWEYIPESRGQRVMPAPRFPIEMPKTKPKRLMLTRDESDEANKMVITACIVGCSEKTKIEIVYLQ